MAPRAAAGLEPRNFDQEPWRGTAARADSFRSRGWAHGHRRASARCQLSRRRLIAVTGTDGKTTVCALLARALGDEMGSAVLAGNTEFGSPLSSLAPTGKPAVVEASSYQLEFCEGPFAQLAVLTNLTEEHLHRHQTMDDYGGREATTFPRRRTPAVPLAAINVNGPFGDKLARELRDAGSTVATFGSAENAEYRVLAASWEATGARIQVRTPTGNDLQISTQLPGWHNAENFVAALAGCELLGLSRPDALEALKTMRGVPGRWELIECGQPFDVVVDFAHSAAGLRQALLTARRIAAARAGASVHLVLCAGGANNPGKRGALAAIASELADRVIVTEGNGRGEPAARVIAGLLADWPRGDQPPRS